MKKEIKRKGNGKISRSGSTSPPVGRGMLEMILEKVTSIETSVEAIAREIKRQVDTGG